MTLRQFEYLSEQDQEYVLQHKAVHIASVIEETGTFTLFQVDSFYLEIQSNHSGKVFTTASFFEETELLEPYLELVDMNEIYACLGYGRMH